jgi:hypothetical protein
MGLFGIGLRGRPASFGGVSQQSVGTSDSSPDRNPSLSLSPSPAASSTSRTIGPSSRSTSGGVAGLPTIRVGGGSSSAPTIRTIGPEVLSPSIIRNLRMPPLVRFLPPLLKPPSKKFEQDTLKVSQFRVVNNRFEAVEKNGISVFRPEIISVMNFLPVDGKGRLGSGDIVESSEQLIKTQYQSLEIRANTIQKLVTDMRKQPLYRNQLDAVKNAFVAGLSSTKTSLKYFADLIEKINILKKSLDPKKIPVSHFNTTTYLPLSAFFESKMQYSRTKFANFSDSKIINQLIFDFRGMLEGYSVSLFDLIDQDRATDTSPITIDKTYTQTNGFSFSPSSVRSEVVSKKANKSDFFNQFLNSLPVNPDDRIKLLVHFLSKELRVSKQLGRAEVSRDLLSRYDQGDSGIPFDNITGDVGDNIFIEPKGINSLASLTHFKLDGNNIVLPFESVYVDSDDEKKVYVPGSTYFVDTILEVGPNGYNIQPYTTYANKFDEITSNAKTTIETLLELKKESALSPGKMYDIFLNSMAEATAGLSSISGINKSQAFGIAIFKLATTDAELKNLLFEYLLLLGLCSITSNNQKSIFIKLAVEMETIRAFQHVKVSSLDSPSLIGGQNELRPFLEDLANEIEEKVFSLILRNLSINPGLRDTIKYAPSIKPNIFSSVVSGPAFGLSSISAGSGLIDATRASDDDRLSNFIVAFRRGEIKDALLSSISATDTSSTNLLKEFVDIATKLDQLASISSNQVYILNDGTTRTRQNYFSISTLLLFIFETLSSLVSRYGFASFNKTVSFVEGTIIVNTRPTHIVKNAIKGIVDTKHIAVDKSLLRGLGEANSLSGLLAPTPPFSLSSFDRSKQSIRLPNVSEIPTSTSPSIVPAGFSPGNLTLSPRTTVAGLSRAALEAIKTIGETSFLSDRIKDELRMSEHRRTLTINKTKLVNEDKTIKNILHIFEVLNKQLSFSKEIVISSFSKASLDSFLKTSNLTVEDLKLVKNPSQVRTSAWVFDKYDDKLTEAGVDDETADADTGYLLTDRVPLVNLNAMFNMLKQPNFSQKSDADIKVKILTVGIPAGFSENLSDRVSRTAVSDTNFKDKQFDVVKILVYKRDARFDDIVFKPQEFIFDLSLFPIKKMLPASLQSPTVNYNSIIQRATFRDYESIVNKKEVTLMTLRADSKYEFLSDSQKTQMMKNHLESELWSLYLRLISGLDISEEIFTETAYSKVGLQDQKVFDLITSYLKTVKGKQIPNQNVSAILRNPNLDQETKDTLRLFSYGNILFQSEFVNRRVIEPKLFDRIFHVPINVDKFEIDVETTLSTDSGRRVFTKEQVQNMIFESNGRKFFYPRRRNDMVFEDYFVVIEANLRKGEV